MLPRIAANITTAGLATRTSGWQYRNDAGPVAGVTRIKIKSSKTTPVA